MRNPPRRRCQTKLLAEKQRQVRVQGPSPNCRPTSGEVVALAYLEGLSHSEIAAQLALPLGTVKSRMRIAYQKVRAALENIE